MVVTKVRQIKSQASLKRTIDYAINDSKTLKEVEGNTGDFEVIFVGGEFQKKTVSCHMVIDASNAFDEMMMTNREANRHHGREDLSDRKGTTEVYAHHVIQSFSPDDNLTPEQIHEIGRRTALELTSGHHEFIIATHMDKDHLHNHIIFNATNSSTLKKFRWQKGTKRSLENISDRHAEQFGATIISDRDKIFDHTKYSAYRKVNSHKMEIKSRLDFLLKHSTSLDDFLAKAKALDLAVDTSGKFVKYRLLDRDQERNTRDRTLSQNGAYSLQSIQDRVAKNEVVYSLDEVKNKYQELQQEKVEDFELRLNVKSWQVEQESSTGIYLELDYGLRNHGLVKIPYRFVDKLDDGNFDIFVKRTDLFYFTNPDKADKNRFITGDILVKQLAHHNGDYILKKNPNISKLDELIREFSFLNEHGVTNSSQFDELSKRFEKQLTQTDETLSILDDKMARLNKIRGALEDYNQGDTVERLVAQTVLETMSIPLDYPVSQLDKELVEISVERTNLKETLDRITFDYKKAETIKEHHREEELSK